MNNSLDKNILMVAVVGIVAVVGLFALLGSDEGSTGRAVYGENLYQQCLVRFSDALNVEEVCDCKFPLRENGGRDSESACLLDAVYPEEEQEIVYEGRGGEGSGGAFATSRTQRIFATSLMDKALAGGYSSPEDWVKCKLDGGTANDCEIYKADKQEALPITGNFVNIYKVCLAKEKSGGRENPNADLYCMCRENNNRDCRERFGSDVELSISRSEFDACVEELNRNAVRKSSLISSPSTKGIWRACGNKLTA